MTAEMLEASRQWLPQFEGKSLRPTPRIDIPADVRRVDVPTDPALVIAHRFIELIQE
jgi:alpha-galactosidase